LESAVFLATVTQETQHFARNFNKTHMSFFSKLVAEAEKTVAAAKRKLPRDIARHADKLPVAYHDWSTEEILGDEFEPDILGLFIGDPLGVEPGLGNTAPAHVLLFLESIYDYADGDMAIYRDEVRLTYLHELGHYLGWDEEDMEARGLD
jgi:predicted Zn-dependent protease with MMP-like domain